MKRTDIPSSVDMVWTCAICKKQIRSEEEQYQAQQGFNTIIKSRFIPKSRYWHETINVEFCSPECSLIYHP